MENDLRAMLAKYREAVVIHAFLKAARASSPNVVALEEQYFRAEAKVQTAEVTLLSLFRSAVRR